MFETRSARLLQVAFITSCFFAWQSGTGLAQTVEFDWAIVGNPGNAADQDYGDGGMGAVANTFRISKHEVTNLQYAIFLNKVARKDKPLLNVYSDTMDIVRTGTNGSYVYTMKPSLLQKPVMGVHFIGAMRFVNWLHNGQQRGRTNTGVYTIHKGETETREAGAKYFLPTENEWYKAAYHDTRNAADGGPPGDDNYWKFPTQNDNWGTKEAH